MARHNIQQLVVTAKFVPDDTDEPFNSAVGHILDCLDSLPKRPDAAFDSLYKVIDQNLEVFSQPNISRMRATVDTFFDAAPNYWAAITELLSAKIPQQSADYAASRILGCHIESNPPHSDQMKKRAERSLGSRRYKQFCDKYLVANPQAPNLFDLPYQNRRNAGRLMGLMFRQTAPLSNPKATSAAGTLLLDLSIRANILSPREKLLSLMEICLSTYRHERFHGEAFSPFRSSKASLKTYAHAYYMLMVSYVIVLGMLQSQGKGGLSISAVYDVAKESMNRFSSFFAKVLDE